MAEPARDPDELRSLVDAIFTDDSDDIERIVRSAPNERLTKVDGLDTSYWSEHEFSSGSPAMRVVGGDDPLRRTLQSYTAPTDLFGAALMLLGDSIITYNDPKNLAPGRRWGRLRFYPPILITYWAGFESFVRLSSEMLTQVCPGVPAEVRDALLEVERVVDRNGVIQERPRRRAVLERYWLLLKYGYGHECDRGGRVWQTAERAVRKRDEFAHYDVATAPSIKALELCEHLEAIALLMIAPSTVLKTTIFPDQYIHHNALVSLHELVEDVEERPVHKGSAFHGAGLWPCTFIGIDAGRYPPAGHWREKTPLEPE